MPPDTYLREDPLRIVDRGLDEITQIGDSIQVTGAEKDADDYRYFDNKVRCSDPYWGGEPDLGRRVRAANGIRR